MVKVILLDLDGIVIRPRHKYFSEKFSEEYNILVSEILPFFKGEYKKAARGEANIREVLPKYLRKWGWKGSLDDFLEYWFRGERTLDVNVLELVRDLRKKGIKVYLASDNEKERANYVMDTLGLKDDFDGAFFSYELGFSKDKPEFYKEALIGLKLNAKDVDYWDDDPKNVKVARKLGINANLYGSFEDFKKAYK